MAHREILTRFAGVLESLKLTPVTTDLDVALQDLTLASNERIYQAVRVHHYTLREVRDFVGLLYSSISMIAKRFHETMKS
jgi:hypothetical protein